MQQFKDDISSQTTSAYDPHDHLIQTLNSVLLQLNSLQALLRNDEAPPDFYTLRDGLNAAEQLTQEAIYEIRSANDDDLPLPNLVGVTLVEALSRAIEETAELLGLSSRITFTSEERPVPSYIERLIYGIAQEALYQMLGIGDHCIERGGTVSRFAHRRQTYPCKKRPQLRRSSRD